MKGGVYAHSNGSLLAYGNEYGTRLGAAERYARAHKGVAVWLQAKDMTEYQGQRQPQVMSVTYRGFFRGMDISQPTPGEQIGVINPETFTRQVL